MGDLMTHLDKDEPVAADVMRRVVLVSPIPVVGLGFLVARLSADAWGAWSWIPMILYYWGILLLLTAWSGGRESLHRWLGPSQTGRWIWIRRALALAVPALFLPTAFLSGLASMSGGWVVVAWFSLGAVNAWVEEAYWRGLLLDAASGWPGWLAVSYSAISFAVSRLLIFGWQEGDISNGIAGFLGTLIAGLIWGLVYKWTRSLRLPILGHVLQQMLAPPYSVFIQLVDMFR
jgi:membrane protease YdiL (CAAX protease family)